MDHVKVRASQTYKFKIQCFNGIVRVSLNLSLMLFVKMLAISLDDLSIFAVLSNTHKVRLRLIYKVLCLSKYDGQP